MKLAVLALGLSLLCVPAFAGAATQRPAGGANELDAVEGVMNKPLFNGEVRLRATGLRSATDAEREDVQPPDDQKVIVLSCILSNGTHATFNGVFEYALADSDGVVVSAESRYIVPNPPPDAPPGGAWHEAVSFIVPQNFKPVKLVVTQTVRMNAGDATKAFRIRIDPSTVR